MGNMGDDIGSGSVTDFRLRSDFDLKQHTQWCRAAAKIKTNTT